MSGASSTGPFTDRFDHNRDCHSETDPPPEGWERVDFFLTMMKTVTSREVEQKKDRGLVGETARIPLTETVPVSVSPTLVPPDRE